MRHRRKLSFITCMHSFTQITSIIELRGIVPSNQIKVTFIIILFYPSAWFVFDFFLFHIEIEGNCGWIIGGGGGGGLAPSQIIGWAYPPPPPPPPPHLPTPMKHLNNKTMDTKQRQTPHHPPLPTPMKHLNNKTIDTKHRQIQKEYLLKEVLIEKKN